MVIFFRDLREADVGECVGAPQIGLYAAGEGPTPPHTANHCHWHRDDSPGSGRAPTSTDRGVSEVLYSRTRSWTPILPQSSVQRLHSFLAVRLSPSLSSPRQVWESSAGDSSTVLTEPSNASVTSHSIAHLSSSTRPSRFRGSVRQRRSVKLLRSSATPTLTTWKSQSSRCGQRWVLQYSAMHSVS